MNAPLPKSWTQDQFLAWQGHQEGRYEFDGFQPVAMTGGTFNHNLITQNGHAALRTRLRGSLCRPMGPDAGIATVGESIRYPDALVTCTKTPGAAYLVLGPVVLFEVLSPNSGRTDRIIKVREYAAIPTARRYVILESTGIGLMVFERASDSEAWRATTLTTGDILRMPEIGIEVPAAEFYEDVDFNA